MHLKVLSRIFLHQTSSAGAAFAERKWLSKSLGDNDLIRLYIAPAKKCFV